MKVTRLKEAVLSTRDLVFTQGIVRGLGVVNRDDLIRTGELGDDLWVVEPETTVKLSEPPQELRRNAQSFDIKQVQRLPVSFVRILNDVSLLGPDAVGQTKDGLILETTADPDRALQEHHDVSSTTRSIITGLRSPSRTLPNRYVSLVNNYAHTYYHWLIDILPKLEGAKLYENTNCESVTLLLPTDPPTWMTETLSLIGVSPDTWEVWEGGRGTVSQLVVVSLRRQGNVPTPNSLRWLRKQLLTDNRSSKHSSRLFVSRRDADWRRISNVDEVASTLNDFGFEEFIPSKYTVEEQIAAFQNADYIVGPHGSNLTNIVFCADASVCELFGEAPRTPDFWVLSEMLDLDYVGLVGDSRSDEIVINPQELSRLVSHHL